MDDCGQRVIVGVDGSVGSLRALRRGLTEARLRGSVLYAVLAWSPPGGEIADRRSSGAHLRLLWEQTAWERLQKACTDALGGFPPDVTIRLLVARGTPRRTLVNLADQETDLLVVGAGRRNALRRAFAGSVAKCCTARAHCPVLVVPPSPLPRRIKHPERPEWNDHVQA